MIRPWPRPQPSARTWFFTKLDTPEKRAAADDEWNERASKVEDDPEQIRSERENLNWRSDDVREWLIERVSKECLDADRRCCYTNRMRAACSFALQEDNLARELSWDFICEVNRIVCYYESSNIPSTIKRTYCGNRKKVINIQGQESQVDCCCLPVSRIDEAMAALIETYKERMVPGEQGLAAAICWAADFFLRFNAICPFSSGNGHTARILFSWLLEPFLPVPISLFAPSYEDSLRYTHCQTPGSHPRRLYRLSIQAAYEKQNVGFFHRYALEAVLCHLRDLEIFL